MPIEPAEFVNALVVKKAYRAVTLTIIMEVTGQLLVDDLKGVEVLKDEIHNLLADKNLDAIVNRS